MRFPNNLSSKDFLKEYWEQKFLFMPGVVNCQQEDVNTQELLEMAQDEYFETRLVTMPESDQWEVQNGPFESFEFTDSNLPWTLMVYNLNLYNNLAFELEKMVDFIPSWLFDDVMCTYSNKGSTVGAHYDPYNVFIMQVSGQRKWEIQKNPKPEFRDDCNIKVLKEFESDEEYTLNPGDMIFIPPGVAHKGTSLTDNSVSLSIGFKSLDHKEILQNFLFDILENDKYGFYKSSSADFVKSRNAVSDSITSKLKDKMLEMIEGQDFQESLIKVLTRTKVGTPIQNEAIAFDDFFTLIQEDGFQFFEDIRLVSSEDRKRVFINQNETKINELEKLQKDLLCRGEILFCTNKDYGKDLYWCYQKGFLAINK